MTIIVKQFCGSVIPGPTSRKDKKPVKDCEFDFPRNFLGVIAKFPLNKFQEECCVQDVLPRLGDTGVSEISVLLIHNIFVQLVRNRST